MSQQRTEEFKAFMSDLLDTHVYLDYFTDFEKCNANVRKIAMKLNQLNYLLGKEDLEQAIRELWDENPQAFSVLDVLIAVRIESKKQVMGKSGEVKPLSSYFGSVEGVIEFVQATGLCNVFKNKQVTNLVDYVFGVEVGLDTNARKNRSGKVMAQRVATAMEKGGISYRTEVKSSEFPEIAATLGKDEKRFDFVVRSGSKIYLIEVNFYGDGGSKPNEVARAYIELAQKINACPGYEFVWITDGRGWKKAQGKLEEAFYAIPSVYNLTTIDRFIERL